MQVSLTVCGIVKTTGYIRLGPYMPDIILLKQEIEYELMGDQVIDPRTYPSNQNPIPDQLMFPYTQFCLWCTGQSMVSFAVVANCRI